MIYLHVPFCRSFCTYCSFYSEVCSKARQDVLISEYEEAVLAEISERREEISENMLSAAADTLYIGGGTPSVLPLDVLCRIADAIGNIRIRTGEGIRVRAGKSFPESEQKAPEDKSSSSFNSASGPLPLTWPRAATPVGPLSPLPSEPSSLGNFAEFTIEVNPEDIIDKGEEYVLGLLELGVSRISMGVQSFDDGILKWMNRRHSTEGTKEAYRTIRRTAAKAGKEVAVSIDLIFGLTQLSDETWNSTISQALSLGAGEGLPQPEHISAYQLSIEEGSALEKLVGKGRYTEATDELCSHQYDILCRRLSEAGYHHYEVSNFALPGHEAVHNGAYWKRIPYVGLGPGAHSFRIERLSDGSRRESRLWNSQELPHRDGSGLLKTYSKEEEVLGPEDIRIERIMLALRTDCGMEEATLRDLADEGTIEGLLEEGALEKNQGRIRIPESRFFTSDEIIRELI